MTLGGSGAQDHERLTNFDRRKEVKAGQGHCLSLGEESSCVQAFDRGNTWATRGLTEAFVYWWGWKNGKISLCDHGEKSVDGQDQPPYFAISLRVTALLMNDLYCSERRGRTMHWSLENLSTWKHKRQQPLSEIRKVNESALRTSRVFSRWGGGASLIF